MRKLTSLILASSLAFGAASVVHAEADNLTPPPAASAEHHKPSHNERGHHGPMMFKGLQLTEAQKQQIREIMKASHEQMKRPTIEQRRAEHAIIASDSFDRSKADAEAAQMTAGAKDRALQRLETGNKLYNVLTAEQKKQYNANFEKHLTEKPGQGGHHQPRKAD